MSKEDYLFQIRQLVELQKIDDEIFAVKKIMENAPRDLGELEEKFLAIESRRERVLDKLSHLKDQKKRVSLEIDDDASRIKKSKNKLMQVENTREYQAMLREMDSMEKINRNREEERLTLQEELNTQNGLLEIIDTEFNAIKAELEEKRGNLDGLLAEANQRLESLNRKRQEASKSIPRPIFMRYEFIRERLEHPVIVPAQNGVCDGCHIAVPPQTFIELQMGQQILSCPNCQRLIFWDRHFEDPETAVTRAREIEAEPEAEEEASEDN